ncbi:MAG: stage II sporulation protein M [Desulfobacteraceae bacterium]|nr:MAG: stage II sporulation protein M [Desulfobacteraceae bacterium]
MSLHFFKEAIPHAEEARLHILAAIAFFLAGVLIGFLRPDHFPGSFRYLSDLAAYLRESSALAVILFLFLKNSLASFIVLWAGTLLGIIPLMAAAQNGYLMGAVLSWQESPFISFLNLLPHGIFELPAFFLACGIGIWRGLWIFRKNKAEPYRERAKKGYLIFYRLVLPLLIIAAVIEGLRIAQAG